jgi:FtsZ-interacting cell division protein ZipA
MWPEHPDRRILAVRLVAAGTERFTGRALRQALGAEGFVFGKFSIFHKPGPDSRAVVSATSLNQPGSFELQSMDVQRFGGLNLFTVLPGSLGLQESFDELLGAARNLNERLHGVLQDETGAPLTAEWIESVRASFEEAERGA